MKFVIFLFLSSLAYALANPGEFVNPKVFHLIYDYYVPS